MSGCKTSLEISFCFHIFQPFSTFFFVSKNALWRGLMWPWNTALKMVWDWGVPGLSHEVDGCWERDAAWIANYHIFLSFWHEYPCKTTVQLAGVWSTPWKNMAVRDHHWLCWQRVHPLTAHLQDINKSRPQKVWCSNIFDLLKFLKHKKQVNSPVSLIRLCGNLAPAWTSHKPRASGMTSQRRDDLNGPCRALAEHGSFMEDLQRIHEHSWTFMNILNHTIYYCIIYIFIAINCPLPGLATEGCAYLQIVILTLWEPMVHTKYHKVKSYSKWKDE